MTRRPRRSTDRPHRRFSGWLVAAPSGDPPRELAVHAAGCPECQRIVAAMDELASVDLGLAGLPEAPATPGRFAWLIVTRRAAMAGASLAAFAAVAFIGWRFFLAPEELLLGANLLASPTQAVQGGVGSPQPSVFPGVGESPVPGTAGADPTGGPDTTAAPSSSFGPAVPGASTPAVQPTSGPAANAPPGTTPQPTSVARPSAPATQPPPPPPTPRATPAPPPPTPEPTPPPPTPVATPGGPLPECADLQDNDGDGFIDLLDLDCLDVFDLSESS